MWKIVSVTPDSSFSGTPKQSKALNRDYASERVEPSLAWPAATCRCVSAQRGVRLRFWQRLAARRRRVVLAPTRCESLQASRRQDALRSLASHTLAAGAALCSSFGERLEQGQGSLLLTRRWDRIHRKEGFWRGRARARIISAGSVTSEQRPRRLYPEMFNAGALLVSHRSCSTCSSSPSQRPQQSVSYPPSGDSQRTGTCPLDLPLRRSDPAAYSQGPKASSVSERDRTSPAPAP
jgi:hypothetical protein